jgi:hypothetical protein
MSLGGLIMLIRLTPLVERPVNLHMSDQKLSLWGLLRGQGHLWHRTSIAALDGILRDHEITPNTGQFVATTSQSGASFARRMGAVSLFDFDAASEEDFMTHRCDYWCGNIFIRICRGALDPAKLRRAENIWAEETLPDEDKHKLVLIPHLEVLHIGPVQDSVFDGLILLSPNEDCWHETTSNPAGLSELSAMAARWNTQAERAKAERRAKGKYTLAEIVEACQNLEG